MKYIHSLEHPYVKRLVKLRRDKQFRHEEGTVLLEGKNAIADVCNKREAITLLLQEGTSLPIDLKAQNIIHVSPAIFKKITSVESPEGMIAEIKMPGAGTLTNKRYIVACDSIQDPGNLGTIMRTALALGWDALFLIGACADPFNDKALRAAKGATFELPLIWGSWSELAATGLPIVVSSMKGKIPKECCCTDGCVLVLGNEAHGVTMPPEIPHTEVHIPMRTMESLNVAVAGGILMYVIMS